MQLPALIAVLDRIDDAVLLVDHSPGTALAMIDSQRSDFALLGISMPGLSGYEIARTIRDRPWDRQIVLIAMTGWGRDQDRRAALEAGFDHHLTKP